MALIEETDRACAPSHIELHSVRASYGLDAINCGLVEH